MVTHRFLPERIAWTKQGSFPSPAVLLSARLQRYYDPLRLPPGQPPTSRLITGYRTPRSGTTPQRAGRGGPLLFPPSPSTRSTSPTPGGSSRLHIQALHLFHGLHPEAPGSAPPCSHLSIGTRTTRQTSLHAADRVVAPPVGLSTSGFDPDRFQPEPPTCYRASWQLPGPDSHRLATTSMSPDWSRHRVPNPSSSGRTALFAYQRARPCARNAPKLVRAARNRAVGAGGEG